MAGRVGPRAERISQAVAAGPANVGFSVWRSQAGVLISGPLLIRKAGLEIERPIDTFPRNKYPQANRAYRTIVWSDRSGRYRLVCDKYGAMP